RLWDDLADSEEGRATGAGWALQAQAERSIDLFRRHLRPGIDEVSQTIGRLLGELDNERFAVRERATKELIRLGRRAEAVVRHKLADPSTAPEVRKRLREIANHLPEDADAGERRLVRAVRVLEAIATPDARRLLEELARGAPGAVLTQEAKTSLARLAAPPR